MPSLSRRRWGGLRPPRGRRARRSAPGSSLRLRPPWTARGWSPGGGGSTIVVDVPINGRVGAPEGAGLSRDTVGCYIGAGAVDVPLPAGAAAAPDQWALASAVHATVHAPGYRASEVSAFGVFTAVLGSAPGRAMLRAAARSPAQQGRIIPPAVSNVGRCGLTDEANGRAAASAAAPPTVGAIRLMDWEAVLGAPLVLYACTVGGRMALVLTSTEPLVSTATAAAVLAAVVKTIEAAA